MQYCGKGNKETRGILPAASSERCYQGKKQSSGFFLRIGIRPDDVPRLRKAIIQLSMTTQAGIDYLYSLPVSELLDLMKEVTEVVNERKRVSAGNKNSGYR